ncbi:hypothetical protein M9H77_02395 [Catharanthus roseus]|uniref:Uncharacterized protein n=1 Tax=Catharanthus roseus TaxID=4058 RepID=A0ACC0C8P5_CATRO|nr:hypothetical protein M9H77_02395 [Catharanthus roseus]
MRSPPWIREEVQWVQSKAFSTDSGIRISVVIAVTVPAMNEFRDLHRHPVMREEKIHPYVNQREDREESILVGLQDSRVYPTVHGGVLAWEEEKVTQLNNDGLKVITMYMMKNYQREYDEYHEGRDHGVHTHAGYKFSAYGRNDCD